MTSNPETRPRCINSTKRATRWYKRFLAVSAAPALLALAGTSFACLDSAAPEYADVLAALELKETRLDWEKLIPPPGQPGRAAVLTAIANVLIERKQYQDSEHYLEQAIAQWVSEGHASGELCARRHLAVSQSLRGATDQALATLTLAHARALDSDPNDQLNRIVYNKIRLQLALNERLEEALVELERHPPGADDLERLLWLSTRGSLFNRLGRLYLALADYEQSIELAAAIGHDVLLSSSRTNRDRVRSQLADASLARTAPEDIARETKRIINSPATLPQSRFLAMLFLAGEQSIEDASATLESCRQQALADGYTSLAGVCMAELALLQIKEQPAAALQLMNEAVHLTEQSSSAQDRQRLVQARIRFDWQFYSPMTAMQNSLGYLETTRAIRQQQSGGEQRAHFLAYWSGFNRLLAGLAYGHANDDPELLAPAFTVLEDTRAQVLRELRLDDGAPEETAQATAQRISEIQRALIEAPAASGQVEDLNEQLRRLDLEFRQALLVAPEAVPSPAPPPALEALQAALAPGEALLSALTDTALQETREDGWMHIITHEKSFAVPIPGHLQLTRWSRTLGGMNNWSALPAQGMLEHVGQALLEPIIQYLPDNTRRLILVPDKGLHELPLGALTLPDGQPLGVAFELEIAPSAGLWLALRQAHKMRGSALVLADPDLPASGYQRLDPAFADRLEPLPGARIEARHIRTRLGSGAKVLAGPLAAESALSAPNLEAHALLHFGAHTLIHPTVLSRSAIVLTPADQKTDGLLQPREILNLDLNGRAAILAVCAGAGGEWVDGEGLLSLAHAFIGAGSVAVVANRWPVDDQHARVFFDRVYRQLARGRSLSSALNHASQELHQAGYPPEAWAGYVLIGDGAWSPVARVRSWTGLACLLLGILLLAWAWYLRPR